MSTVTSEIAKLLADWGIGVLGKTLFFTDDSPDRPDAIIQIIKTTTASPDMYNKSITMPVIQVFVRGARGANQETEERADLVRDALKNITNVPVYDAWYSYFNHMSGPDSIGVDDVMRPRYTINFRCSRSVLRVSYKSNSIQGNNSTCELTALKVISADVSVNTYMSGIIYL